ncbi:Cof-type HAD-IIB family hydrolase [Listeria floridensis]|nr:Cof-type HAD-IIB family hydrolase [Listeria floridensis]
MPIKAISVDMDGTFLDSNGYYDRDRFDTVFQAIQQNGILFIVASGNQYAQLKSFFPNKDEQIIYVSENGALTFQNNRLLAKHTFSIEIVKKIVAYLTQESENLEFVLCGVSQAYMTKSASLRFKEFAKTYYFSLNEVEDFKILPNDDFVKFALDVKETEVNRVVLELNSRFKNHIKAVSSGHGSIDIMLPNITKGTAVRQILEKNQLDVNELLAFGDADNDIEMLQLTKFSYAMKQSSNSVKSTAHHQAPSNNESGVLQIIETVLQL